MLFPISKHSKPGANGPNRQDLFPRPERGRTVIGAAIAFPWSESAATVEYLAGPSGVRPDLDNDDID